MRLKPVPPAPSDLAVVFEVRDALPLVPGTEDDCCARIVSRTAVADRGVASDWLTFLRALGLARETDRGFVRERADPDRRVLGERFESNVYGAREVLDALDEAPRGAADAFAAFDAVPRWERARDPDWEATWRDRVRRLLEWAVLFGRADRVADGYVTA